MNAEYFLDTDGEKYHVLNEQRVEKAVFELRPNINRDSSVCAEVHAPNRNALKLPVEVIDNKESVEVTWSGGAVVEFPPCEECIRHVSPRSEPPTLRETIEFHQASEPLRLSARQRHRAKQVIRTLESEVEDLATGESRNTGLGAVDLVDEWEPIPPSVSGSFSESVAVEQVVPVEEIRGGGRCQNVIPERIESILHKMLHGGWDLHRGRKPPQLIQTKFGYYVDADGNHRALVYKILGLDTLYAEVCDLRHGRG